MQLLENTATILEMLWDIALAYFVIRLGAVYAMLAVSSSVAISFVAAWATQHNSILQAAPLLSAAQLASIVACALFINRHHEVPRDWRLRAGVGGIGALLVTCATTALRPIMASTELEMAGRGYLACVAVMPMVLTALEGRSRKARRDSKGLLHGNEKNGF